MKAELSPKISSDREWRVRIELAAAHRLMAYYGFGELAQNHLCARVPDEPDAFLIKPVDLFYEEVTASSLIKYDFAGNPRQPGATPLAGAGLIIHGGVFAARPEVHATLHAHSTDTVVVGCQRDGLLPLTQEAVPFIGSVAYADFAGLEISHDQTDALVARMQGKDTVFLRNHGVLVLGPSIGAVMTQHYKLDRACRAQVAAQATGVPLLSISPELVGKTQAQIKTRPFYGDDGGVNWQGMLRLARRLFPDHED